MYACMHVYIHGRVYEYMNISMYVTLAIVNKYKLINTNKQTRMYTNIIEQTNKTKTNKITNLNESNKNNNNNNNNNNSNNNNNDYNNNKNNNNNNDYITKNNNNNNNEQQQ